MNNQGNMIDSWVPVREGALGTLGPTLAPHQAWRDRITLISGADNAAGRLCERSDSHASGRTTLVADVFTENIDRRDQVTPSSDQVSNGSFAPPSFAQVLGRRSCTQDQYSSLNLGVGTSMRSAFLEAGRGTSLFSEMDPARVGRKRFAESGYDVYELLVAFVTHESLAYRLADDVE